MFGIKKLRERVNAQSKIQTEQGRDISTLKTQRYRVISDFYELFDIKSAVIDKELDDIREVIDASNKANAEALASNANIWEMLLWGIKNPPKYKEGDKCKYGEVVATNIFKDADGYFSWEYTAKNSDAVTVF